VARKAGVGPSGDWNATTVADIPPQAAAVVDRRRSFLMVEGAEVGKLRILAGGI